MDFNDILDISPDHVRHRLAEPIDLNRLLNGEGVSFEVDGHPPFISDDAHDENELPDGAAFQDPDFLDSLKECNYFDDDDDNEEEEAEAEAEEVDEEGQIKRKFERLRSKMMDITDGRNLVFKRVQKHGDGEKIPEGAQVYYHYRMYTTDALEPFDSTRFRRRLECQVVGNQSVLAGMETALLSMRKKERAVFLIHYSVMYGEMGCPPRIPARAEIYTEIEVVDFICKGEMEDYYDMDPEEREQLKYDQVIVVVKQSRHDGNIAFKSGRFAAALRKYQRARQVLESVFVQDVEEDERRKDDLKKILTNMAICLKRLNRMPLCISTCNDILAIDPETVKAHYFKGIALSSIGEYREAAISLKRADRLQPHTRDILNAIEKNNELAQKYKQLCRQQCSRMLGFDAPPPPPVREERTPDIETNFARRLDTKLQDFVEDDQLTTYPDFDTTCYSEAEVAVIRYLAEAKGLRIVKGRDAPHLWSIRKPL